MTFKNRLSPCSILHKVKLLNKAINNDKPQFAATLLRELSFATRRSAVKCFDRYRIFNTSIVFKTMQQENESICDDVKSISGDSILDEDLSSTHSSLELSGDSKMNEGFPSTHIKLVPHTQGIQHFSLKRTLRPSVVPLLKERKRPCSTEKEKTSCIVQPSSENEPMSQNDLKLNNEDTIAKEFAEYQRKVHTLQYANGTFNHCANHQFIEDDTGQFVANPNYVPRPPSPEFDYLSDSEIDMTKDHLYIF